MNCQDRVINIVIDPSKLTWISGISSYYVKLPAYLLFKLTNAYEISITQIISIGLKKAEILDVGCSLVSGTIVDDEIFPLLRRCMIKKGYFVTEFTHRDYMKVSSPEVASFIMYLKLPKSSNTSFNCSSLSVTLHIRECLS